MTVSIRFKEPRGSRSSLVSVTVVDKGNGGNPVTDDFRFASSVAAFGMMLRGSAYKGGTTFESILDTAESSIGTDAAGHRSEFVSLVRKARALMATSEK